MQMMCWLFALMIFVGVTASNINDEHTADHQDGESDAIATSMIIYRNHVSNYADANPGYTGAVSDSSLALPTWYRKFSGISGYVTAGRGFVYYSGRPELVGILMDKTEAITVGFNRNGLLVNPAHGTTAITIPNVIPENAAVYAE